MGPELVQKDVPDCLILKVVIDCPEDAELPVFYNQVQDGPEAFSNVKVICATALLPGIHGEQLQGVLWG